MFFFVCVCVCFITCRAYKNLALGDLSIFSHGSKFESAASFFLFFFAGDMIDWLSLQLFMRRVALAHLTTNLPSSESWYVCLPLVTIES